MLTAAQRARGDWSDAGGASGWDCVQRVAAAVNDFAGSNHHADDQTPFVIRVT